MANSILPSHPPSLTPYIMINDDSEGKEVEDIEGNVNGNASTRIATDKTNNIDNGKRDKLISKGLVLDLSDLDLDNLNLAYITYHKKIESLPLVHSQPIIRLKIQQSNTNNKIFYGDISNDILADIYYTLDIYCKSVDIIIFNH
ncbi:unnamed protein product [Cunninghamella echinulata]